jgi:hypothetical protein
LFALANKFGIEAFALANKLGIAMYCAGKALPRKHTAQETGIAQEAPA